MPSGTTPMLRLTSTGWRAGPGRGSGWSRRWGEQAGEHLDGGGLAGAVGAEEAEELAGLDDEIEVVDGGEAAGEGAGETVGGDGWSHVCGKWLVASGK
jgi:hypothetical protein